MRGGSAPIAPCYSIPPSLRIPPWPRLILSATRRATFIKPLGDSVTHRSMEQLPAPSNQGPGTGAQGPMTTDQGPGASQQDPQTISHLTGVKGQVPGANRQGPGARCQGPGARCQVPEKSELRLENKCHGSGASGHGAGARHQGPGARHQRLSAADQTRAPDEGSGAASHQRAFSGHVPASEPNPYL